MSKYPPDWLVFVVFVALGASCIAGALFPVKPVSQEARFFWFVIGAVMIAWFLRGGSR